MPRPKTNENPVVSRTLIRNFLDGYDERQKIYKEQQEAFRAEKRALHDYRNNVIETTKLLLQPVEWAANRVRQHGAAWCVSWLHAVVLTFAEMGVFDQADMFLVDELVEEIQKTRTVAA